MPIASVAASWSPASSDSPLPAHNLPPIPILDFPVTPPTVSASPLNERSVQPLRKGKPNPRTPTVRKIEEVVRARTGEPSPAPRPAPAPVVAPLGSTPPSLAPAEIRFFAETQTNIERDKLAMNISQCIILWMMHPSGRAPGDFSRFCEVMDEVTGDVTLWQAYSQKFWEELSWVQRAKAYVVCWVLTRIVPEIINKTFTNVARTLRSNWAEGNLSRTIEKRMPVLLELFEKFLQDYIGAAEIYAYAPHASANSLKEQRRQIVAQNLKKLCREFARVLFDESSGCMNGVSMIYRKIMTWYAPNVMANLIGNCLKAVEDKPDAFQQAVAEWMAGQFNDFTRALQTGKISLSDLETPTFPGTEKLSLIVPKLLDAIELTPTPQRLLKARSTVIERLKEVYPDSIAGRAALALERRILEKCIHDAAQSGLGFLIQHPEVLEAILKNSLSLCNRPFAPPSPGASYNPAAAEAALLAAARNFTSCVVEKRLSPDRPPTFTPQRQMDMAAQILKKSGAQHLEAACTASSLEERVAALNNFLTMNIEFLKLTYLTTPSLAKGFDQAYNPCFAEARSLHGDLCRFGAKEEEGIEEACLVLRGQYGYEAWEEKLTSLKSDTRLARLKNELTRKIDHVLEVMIQEYRARVTLQNLSSEITALLKNPQDAIARENVLREKRRIEQERNISSNGKRVVTRYIDELLAHPKETSEKLKKQSNLFLKERQQLLDWLGSQRSSARARCLLETFQAAKPIPHTPGLITRAVSAIVNSNLISAIATSPPAKEHINQKADHLTRQAYHFITDPLFVKAMTQMSMRYIVQEGIRN